MPEVSFTLPGVPLSDDEFTVGDSFTAADLQKIADHSGVDEDGKPYLTFDPETGHLTGTNPDGSGDVDIQAGEPITEDNMGLLHDLHHTVAGSGGIGNDGSPKPLDGGSSHQH